jgi:hypothetical protein
MKEIILVLPLVLLLAGCKLGGGGSGSAAADSVLGDDPATFNLYSEFNQSTDFLSDSPPSEPSTTVVPEPSTAVILAMGLAGLAVGMFKAKKRKGIK